MIGIKTAMSWMVLTHKYFRILKTALHKYLASEEEITGTVDFKGDHYLRFNC